MNDTQLPNDATSPRAVVGLPYSRPVAGLALALLAAQCLAAVGSGEALGDLAIYRGAVERLADGGNLYEFRYEHASRPEGYPFTYPPFAAMLLLPLTWVSPNVSNILWTAGVGATAIAIAVVVAISASGRNRGEMVEAPIVARWDGVLLVLALSYPLLHNVVLGEISLLISFLALLDVSGLVPHRWRGFLVGVASAIKLTPLIFIAYFVVVRDRRAAIQATAAFVVAGAVGFALLPSESRMYWGSLLFETENVGEISSSRNKAIAGLLARLGLEGDPLLAAWVLVAGAVGVVALYRARVHHLDGAELRAAVVIGCASVAVSPISWAHHQVWGPLAAAVMMQLTRPSIAAVTACGAMLVFFAFSPTQGLSEEGTIAMIVGWELPTLVFVLVSLAGLPRWMSRN